jgi:hypothetical protein
MRAARNAYSHGLSSSLPRPKKFIQELDRRARKIAGDTSNPLMLGWSCAAAEAELELARVRQAKIAIMDRAGALCQLYIPELCELPSFEVPSKLEIMRRTIAELLKINRYEQRAASRLDNALRQIVRFRQLANTEELK